MNYAVRYQSNNGNTKSIAEVIAAQLGVEAHTLDTSVPEDTDVLLVGGGIYALRPDKSLRSYLAELDQNRYKAFVAFSTSGGSIGRSAQRLTDVAEANGIRVTDSLHVLFGAKGHKKLGLKGGKPGEKQISAARVFADKIKTSSENSQRVE